MGTSKRQDAPPCENAPLQRPTPDFVWDETQGKRKGPWRRSIASFLWTKRGNKGLCHAQPLQNSAHPTDRQMSSSARTDYFIVLLLV